MSEWDMILDDLLEVIVETLRPQDVASMRIVCSTWRAKLDSLLLTLQLRQPLYIPNMAARFQGLSHVHLCFYAQDDFTPATLQPLQHLRRLHKLTLENEARAQPTLVGLQQLAAQLPLLDHLSARAFVVGADSGLGAMKQLRNLNLTSCILMPGKMQGFPALLEGLSRLEFLACEGCSGLSTKPFAGIESLVSLKTCLLNCSLRTGDDTCLDISILPQVQTLGLASSALKGCLTPACITQAGLQSLCGMTQLTALDLSGHAAISDASIALIAQHLFSLRQLDLRKPACDTPATDSVTDTGIATLRSLTALESLRVSQAQVGQVGCAALATLSSLRCLELSYCESLSDTPVCELTRLSALTELCLAGCASITDIAVATLVHCMAALARLDLSACHLHVGDISLHTIATLPKLQVLRLHSCERVSDAGIEALCAGAAAATLTHLDMRGCERISDKGVAALGRSLKQLQYLSLEHCHLVGDRGIRHLSQLPQLETLRLGGTAASLDSFSEDFARRVRLKSLSKSSIWWMLDT